MRDTTSKKGRRGCTQLLIDNKHALLIDLVTVIKRQKKTSSSDPIKNHSIPDIYDDTISLVIPVQSRRITGVQCPSVIVSAS